MPEIIDQSSENHIAETSAPLPATVSGSIVSAPDAPSSSSLPSPADADRSPAHLAGLADRARGYVEAASSANTRKAYAADWKHFSAW